MKKVRAYITVDLKINNNLKFKDVEEMLAVGKYQFNRQKGDIILLKDKDFEVIEYVDIEVKDHEDIPFIKE